MVRRRHSTPTVARVTCSYTARSIGLPSVKNQTSGTSGLRLGKRIRERKHGQCEYEQYKYVFRYRSTRAAQCSRRAVKRTQLCHCLFQARPRGNG